MHLVFQYKYIYLTVHVHTSNLHDTISAKLTFSMSIN